ncbi:MAG TPA: lamin tail domain-containing protein [Candidatus Saccharimonadales bacterium]|nr:lamin tail domain-containing protein [Candidatus Saccharimonadales bacterium]
MRFTSSIALSIIIMLGLVPVPVRAVEPAVSSSIVISEIQAGTANSASDEFIELYNPTDSDVALEGWRIEYRGTAATSPLRTASLTGAIKSHGFYLLSANGFVAEADATFTAGLNVGGGYVQLFDNAEDGGQIIDALGWNSDAALAETAAVKGLVTGHSLERLPGRLIEDGGNATDTGDNSKDFIIRTTPQPQSSQSPLEVPTTETPVTEGETPADETAPEPPTYLPLVITELLVDPAAPLTDAADEFIELYNPNDQAVELAGYTVRTGSNFHDYYVLPAQTIAAGGYLVLNAAETKLGLTNSGGAAQLLDPSGTLVSQTDTYSEAQPGEVWAQFEDGWRWTLQSTPGQANVLVAPLVTTAATANPKAAATKKKAAPKVTAAKATAAKAKKAAAAKKPAAAKASSIKAAFEPRVAAANSADSGWLLIAAIGLTIAYAIYEFRYDLQNYFYRARRHFRAGRSPRSGAPRR